MRHQEQESPGGSPSQPSPNMTLSWQWVTYVVTLIALSLGATLTIVVSTKDVDLLSTVALALAILAFVAQLLVYVADSASDIRQSQQNLQINAQTKEVLTELQTRTQGSESIMKDQFDRVLKYVLREEMSVAAGHESGGTGLIEPSEQLPMSSSPEAWLTSSVRRALTPNPSDATLRKVWVYPTGREAAELVQALADRSPLAIAWFASIAELEIISRRLGIEPLGMNLGDHTPFTDELVKAGLVLKGHDAQGVKRASLTDRGREVMRAYRGFGRVPDEILLANRSARHPREEA